MMVEALCEMKPRDWVALVAIALAVSACGVAGVSYVQGNGWPVFDAVQMVVLTLLFTGAVAVVLALVDVAFFRIAVRGKTDAATAAPAAARSRLARLTPAWSAGSVAVFSLVMAVFWLPWLIANYPGGTYWDTYYQIFQVYPENHPIAVIPWAEIYDQTLTDAWLVDHHPVFTTMVYGLFGWLSDQLTGTWMAGVFLFVCLQGAAHVVAFTAAVAYLRERRCPLVLCFASYAFFCIMPFVSTWALCMVKDSFFGLFCVPYFIMLFEALRTRGASLRRPRTVMLFALCALGLCLTKKTGLFVVIPTAAFAALTLRPSRTAASLADTWTPVKAFASQALLCVIVMNLIFPFGLFPLLNIQNGGRQEVLGPLFQQTARYVVDYGDEVTPDERAAIAAVIDYDKLADQYVFDFEDSVKYRYNLDATTGDLLSYLRVYVVQGLKHPDSYFAAIASLAGFYVAPTAFANIRMVTVDTKMGPDQRYMLWNPAELDDLRLGLDEAYTALGETPVVNLPLLIVTYAFWLPAALIFIALHRRIRCGALFVPALVLLAFCVIAPVYDARYAVPIFDMAPLLVCAVAVLLRQRYAPEASAPAPGQPVPKASAPPVRLVPETPAPAPASQGIPASCAINETFSPGSGRTVSIPLHCYPDAGFGRSLPNG